MPPKPVPIRGSDELVASALAVLDRAYDLSPRVKYTAAMIPLFSGGYDSLCACYVASRHSRFRGTVFHIDTGIGSVATRAYVDLVCREMGWRLVVLQSNRSYEWFVSKFGFPGPALHRYAYVYLKERCVSQVCIGSKYKLLVTGARSSESVRRMGHVEPIKCGETKGDTQANMNRIWLAPCHDWTSQEQRAFVNEMGFPRNPVKDSVLGMSGECFCGAFARPNEFAMIEAVCPDVAREIRRLEQVARDAGISEQNCTWGYRGKASGRKPVEVVETGPMCNTCDRKAEAAGIVIRETGSCTGTSTPSPGPSG